jgi:hypothetical protein
MKYQPRLSAPWALVHLDNVFCFNDLNNGMQGWDEGVVKGWDEGVVKGCLGLRDCEGLMKGWEGC